MKKINLTAFALLMTSAAHAALVIEPEVVPTYTPSANATPAVPAEQVTAPAPAPTNPTATPTTAQPTPAIAQQGTDQDTTKTNTLKALLVQDATNAMHEQPKAVSPDLGQAIKLREDLTTASTFKTGTQNNQVITVSVDEVASTPIATMQATPVERPTPWVIDSGAFLRDVLNQWANQAGWKVIWRMPEAEDFRLDSGNKFAGDFKEAVHSLFGALPQHLQIFARLVPDNSPPLLYVSAEPGVHQ